MAVLGAGRELDVGEGDRCIRFVFDMRICTASESLADSESEEADPDIESSSASIN